MKKILLLLTLTLLLSSCFGEEKDITEKEIKKIQIVKSFEIPINNLEAEINSRELKLNTDNKSELLDLVKSYLKYGDAYYNEKVFANKALNILNIMESEFIVEYLKGYSYEIQTKYQEALGQYNKALSFKKITKDQKINALNQKGHVYDLQGDLEKANIFYMEAEKLDSENQKTMLNRGRYESRIGNNDSAEKYFNKILTKTRDSFLKSEMYYNLSVIYQQKKNGLDKAITYAKRGIQANKDYPNNYLSLGVSYISKGGTFLDKAPKELNEAIRIYPNSSTAYKNLGIYYYIKDDFSKAIENFKKQVDISDKDILLMKNDKQISKTSGLYDLAKSYALNSDAENAIKYLQIALDGKNRLTYSWFLMENTNTNGPFRKISNKKSYKDGVKNIILKYNKK